MPPVNPVTGLSERVALLESATVSLITRVTTLETTVQELSVLVDQLKQNQLKWAPPFRFSMPPLEV